MSEIELFQRIVYEHYHLGVPAASIDCGGRAVRSCGLPSFSLRSNANNPLRSHPSRGTTENKTQQVGAENTSTKDTCGTTEIHALAISNAERQMPWRENHTPYFVLLSEIMLQQTQVNRVRTYFNTFIRLWPSIQDLAQATLSEILTQWQGLGYNRRGKFLHSCANEIVKRHNGIIPNDIATLKTLSGIGEYSASAIMAFAYNAPVIVVETNIRRAIIHHFFKNEQQVEESRIRIKVGEVLDKKNPRAWYWAFMDYGAYLSKHIENPNRKAKAYKKQSKFEGSDRQIRGEIIRNIVHSNTASITKQTLVEQVRDILYYDAKGNEARDILETRIYTMLEKLEKEKMIVSEGAVYYIANE